MFNPIHYGLYFTNEHVQAAHKASEREPFKSAWTYLQERDQSGDLASAMWGSLRCRFEGDEDAGEQAVSILQSAGLSDTGPSYFDTVTVTVALAHCFEMLRDHRAFSSTEQGEWLDSFLGRVSVLNHTPDGLPLVEQVWQGTLNVVAGVVLEDRDIFESGTEIYRQIVRHDIHPEGYMPRAVTDKDGRGLERLLVAEQGLALAAEAASHAGIDLWGYAYRGVSIMTPVPYLLYYYYFPEKWTWDEPPEPKSVQRWFRQYGGFLEIVNRRAQPKDLKPLLHDLRPFYNLYGGGLTTLTHGVAEKKGLFG